MEFYLYTHSVKEFLRARRIAAWVILTLMVAAIGLVWKYVAKSETDTQRYADLTSIFTFHLVALAAAIMTTSIIGQEVEQKTIVYILTRPVSRWKLLLMRYLGAVTVVSLIGILCSLLLSAAVFGGNPLGNSLLVPDIMAIILGAFAYSAFCLLVSLLIVRSMIVCILFILAWETTVPNMPGDLYRLSIYSYMQAIAQHPAVTDNRGTAFLSGDLGNNFLQPSTGYPVLIIVSVILIAFSLWWFTIFEFVPREDSD
ncbi:MAG TPA: ABC transporter permease [Fimbriimonadaceae bacterium]